MKSTLVVIVTMAMVSSAAVAEPEQRIDLAALITRARQAPQPRAALAAARSAHAKADEVGLAWVPQVELLAVGGPSPEVRCHPSPDDCRTTSPTEAGLQFSGVFWRIDARAIMPLYTFGKLSSGRNAAEAGARAADALASSAAADAVLDAARAYYAVKLARELLLMLEEGLGNVDDALRRIDKQLDAGSGEVTETDRYRLRAARAEIEARLSEARRVERTGLAGVHFFAGDARMDVDDAPLTEARAELGTVEQARAAAAGRPERRAALAGAVAADELVDLEWARWWPDLIAVGQATLARAGGADDPSSAFANDPLNVTSFSAGLALRWIIDVGVRPAKLRGVRADAEKAKATVDLASEGLPAEAERAWAEAADAKERLAASRLGEKSARAWLVSVLQSTAAGLEEPKETIDALVAWFNARARVLQAIFDWNVAVIALQRATGQLVQ